MNTNAGYLVPFLAKLFLTARKCSIIEFTPVRRFLASLPPARNVLYDRHYGAIESYVLIWLMLEIVIILFLAVPFRLEIRNPELRPTASFLATLLVFYRLVDIFQAAWNVFLFNRVREGAEPKSAERYLVLTLFNYLESILIFAVLVFVAGEGFQPAIVERTDALRHSFTVATSLSDETRGQLSPLAGGFFIGQVVFTLNFLLVILAYAVSLITERRNR